MSKISIITFHSADNCGSQLQAFALQKILKKYFNQDSTIINYQNNKQKELYAIFRNVKCVKDLFINTYRLFFYFLLKKYKKSFSDFSRNYLKMTEPISSCTELKLLDGKYDVFFTGSDQVWNTKAYDFDDSYFLDFVTKGKKISYAASLGATNILEDPSTCSKYTSLINDFDLISVRENNAKSIIQPICKKNVEVLLDPTLLLRKNDWCEIIDDKPLVKGDYIFYYAFSYGEEANEIVCELSKKYKMPVYIVDAYAWALRRKFKYGFKLSPEFGPLAFLNMVKYASVVLTTSFHGTALSVALGKKFWYLETKMHNQKDDRASSLLHQLGIKNRMQPYSFLITNDIFKEVEYEEKFKIEKKIEDSLNFLSAAIKC